MSEALDRALELEKKAREIMAEAEAKAAALEAEILKLKADERKNAVAEIVQTMANLGISLEEIEKAAKKHAAFKKFKDAAPKKFPPKFKGPNGETWTGTGRKPGWIKDLEASGKSLNDFLIEAPK